MASFNIYSTPPEYSKFQSACIKLCRDYIVNLFSPCLFRIKWIDSLGSHVERKSFTKAKSISPQSKHMPYKISSMTLSIRLKKICEDIKIIKTYAYKSMLNGTPLRLLYSVEQVFCKCHFCSCWGQFLPVGRSFQLRFCSRVYGSAGCLLLLALIRNKFDVEARDEMGG